MVLQLQINEETEWLRFIDDRTYVGVQTIEVYHGNAVFSSEDEAWRVEWRERESRNSRDGHRCPEDRLWYVGSRMTIPSGPDLTPEYVVFFERFQQWGERLLRDGYLGRQGLSLILTVSYPPTPKRRWLTT